MRDKVRTDHEGCPTQESGFIPNQDYESTTGLHTRTIGGEQMFNVDEVRALIVREIESMHKEVSPTVKAAQDARTIVGELIDGLGGSVERFQANCKAYLEDIRQTRFAVVTETAAMTKERKEVRQFFLGSDYNDEIARLREFVDLCERLAKLKASGFLDRVADTLLALDV